MKKLLFLMFALCLCAGLFAQTNDKAEDLRIQRRLMGLKMEGLIPMRFASALDGTPIAGAKVAIEGIGEFETDREGIVTFPERDDGFFTLEFSKEGFVTTKIGFEIKLNNLPGGRFSISPELPRGFRVVLDWGEKPEDLDLHLEKRGGYHIAFWNAHAAEDGSAFLDRDDTRSYGPETITVERVDGEAVYDIYVTDYTNQDQPSSRALSQSGAVVRIYGDNRLLEAFTVPPGRPGTTWRVCGIAGGRVVR
ncbi:MAG: hypothetical protein LBO04_01925 [Spirochaetaceae bacterium]|jgi:hypothetical protein|nr:hypothetical protein [Spirochaetaceae bacterium]